MQICDPLTARQWYKYRKPINLFIAVFGFAVSGGILSVLFGPFIAIGIAGPTMYCFYQFVLRNRTIAIQCPKCKKLVQTNTPWICGTCYWKNLHTEKFPFVNRCEHYNCGAEPKAYQCHHCGDVFFLTHDQQIEGFSMSATFFELESFKKETNHEDAVLKKKQEIELKELAIKEAALDAQLKNFTHDVKIPKKKSIEEVYKGMVQNDDDARRLRAAIDEEFKDNPKERERRHRYVDDIMREML